MSERPDHHEQLLQAMKDLQPALEAFSVVLDTFEGFVNQAKQRGWNDDQARALVAKVFETPDEQR